MTPPALKVPAEDTLVEDLIYRLAEIELFARARGLQMTAHLLGVALLSLAEETSAIAPLKLRP